MGERAFPELMNWPLFCFNYLLVTPGEGSGHPLRYSCLENPTGSRAWRATVPGVARSRPRPSDCRTHAHTLAAGIHVPATATQSRVELLPITRQCLEGVPAQLQSLRDPRRPGIAPGWVKDPVGGSRWASPGASCLSPDADPRPRSHGSPLPQGTQHFILPKCGQQSSPASLSPIIKRRS